MYFPQVSFTQQVDIVHLHEAHDPKQIREGEDITYFSLNIYYLIDILILIHLRKKSHLDYHIMIIYYLHNNSDLTRNYLSGELPKEWASMQHLNTM